MTLLSAIRDALYELGETEVPDSVVGSANETARRMLALAKREGELLSRATNWQMLIAEHTFATTLGTAIYALPSDFGRFQNGSWWDRQNRWELVGPATPAQWQRLQSSAIAVGIRRWFRLAGGQMQLYPTPAASGETVAYEYASTLWCQSAGGTPQATWAADSDTFRLDERLLIMGLKWRWNKLNGLDYTEEFNEYRDERSAAIARDGGSAILDLNGPPLNYDPALSDNIPETGIGS